MNKFVEEEKVVVEEEKAVVEQEKTVAEEEKAVVIIKSCTDCKNSVPRGENGRPWHGRCKGFRIGWGGYAYHKPEFDAELMELGLNEGIAFEFWRYITKGK